MQIKKLITLLLCGLMLIGAPVLAQDDDAEATPEPIPGVIITQDEADDDDEAAQVEAAQAEDDDTEAAVDTAEETDDSGEEDEEESNVPALGVVTFILFGILGVGAAGLGLIGREQQYGEDS